MIFYFSGTGNSRWAAQQIAARTGDRAVDILGADVDVHGQAQIGLVFPIYAWGVPAPMRDFAARLGKPDAFRFAVCTCGAEAGYAMRRLAESFGQDSSYSLVMPNNYVIGADVDDLPTVRRKLAAARADIARLSDEIVRREAVYRVTEGPLAGFKSGPVQWGFEHFARSAKAFVATDACTGCGRCAQDCPAQAITMAAGRPVWAKTCYQCMRCINACPARAIEHGRGTARRGRYTIERALQACGEGENA